MADRFDYDVLVVGSGFGGSVSALRLAEKGYRVGVLEAGRRFTDRTLPKTSWRLRRFLWAPKLGLRGIQRITFLRDVVVLSGAGVGGGSLVYANVLYRPLGAFFADRQWAHIADWAAELGPHYSRAERMLGAVPNPTVTRHDRALLAVANDLGVESSFRVTPVGVYFGEAGKEVPDPYFGGEGPARRGCVECGECMIGCRYGAKNRLDRNYLFLAERRGAVVHADTMVTSIRPLDGEGYEVRTRSPRPWPSRGRTFRAKQVVLSAGALETTRLLLRMRGSGELPGLSERVGHLVRTNSQSLRGAERSRVRTEPGEDLTSGVAITSSIYPSADTHVEPVRYGKGSNFMGGLFTVMLNRDSEPDTRPWRLFLRQALRNPGDLVRVLWRRRWSERTSVLVAMQTLDNSITLRAKGQRLVSEHGHGTPNPEWIPLVDEVTRRMADELGGRPRGTLGEIIGAPMTAHPIGGCVIGDSPASGVVDEYHRVYGHPGLHVVDASSIPANLGANPALTVTAMAERAMSLWPKAGEADARPPL